jgi:large repetitive protein
VWSDPQGESQTISIVVSDGKGGTSLQAFDLTVVESSGNEAPTFTSTPRETVGLGNPYFYDANAVDADPDLPSTARRLTLNLYSG